MTGLARKARWMGALSILFITGLVFGCGDEPSHFHSERSDTEKADKPALAVRSRTHSKIPWFYSVNSTFPLRLDEDVQPDVEAKRDSATWQGNVSWKEPIRWVLDQLLVQFARPVWEFPQGRTVVFVKELKWLDPAIQEILQRYGVFQVRLQFDVDRVLREAKDKYPYERWKSLAKNLPSLRHRYLLLLDDPKNLNALKKALDQSKEVKKTSYDYYSYSTAVPNDPLYSKQWGLPFIHAEEAWDVATDASNVRVAVLDGGFQEDHEDLVGNTVGTYDAVDDDADPTSGIEKCDNHGTHVAGIIGAVGNNNLGVSGVFWAGNLFLYRKGIQNSKGKCASLESYQDKATARIISDGADIINQSWTLCSDESWGQDNIDAIKGAILVVNASGNDGDNLDLTGGASCVQGLPNVIVVAAISEDTGEVASYSNFGASSVHLAAPGGPWLVGQFIKSTWPVNQYAISSGTSMATPFVTGVTALAWSQCPSLSVQQIRQIILGTVTPDPAHWAGLTITEGILNAHGAVTAAIAACNNVDNDGDGYTENGGDCNDASTAIHPGAAEICEDGTDQDCSGADLSCADFDNDGDGYTENGGDCNDSSSSIHPSAPDNCDGIDNNCDGVIDPSCDNDGDGLSNSQEWDIGTNPSNPDTDGDGLTDGQEVNTYKTDPLKADTDGDGLTDGQEVLTYKTDPKKADTDDDGLSDGAEVNQYGTNPLTADTDSDGLKDGDEVLTYNTDPLDTDSDNDLLTDGQEVLTYKTDPKNPDTDGDGLSDGAEVNTYKTDPLKADTDGDGLTDGAEVMTYKTDPLDSDSDDDVLSDGDEVLKYGTDPLDANTDDDCLDDGVEVAKGTNPLLFDSPVIVLDPASLDFGEVNRRGKLFYVTLRNEGLTELQVSNAGIAGTGFSMGPAPATVPTGGVAKIPFLYSTTVAGDQGGSASFESNDCFHSPLSFPLKATGLVSEMAASPEEFDFGNLPIWGKDHKPLLLTNPNGNRPLKMTLTTDDPAFFPARLTADVSPGETVEVPVYFRPYRYGPFEGKVLVKSLYGQNTQEIDVLLKGFGDGDPPAISLSVDSIDFGTIAAGQGVTRDIGVSNGGTGRLYIHQVEALGGDGNLPVFPFLGKFTVAPSGERSLRIRFQPAKSGPFQGTLRLRHNAPEGGGILTIPFQGSAN